ncbi:MAG: hypothetical protein ACYSUC_01665 [Planctomycetota bacterium]|jgi:hypothetical protein
MKEERYRRRPGDFEIRVLRDGRLVMIAPDEALLDLARTAAADKREPPPKTESKKHGRNKKGRER